MNAAARNKQHACSSNISLCGCGHKAKPDTVQSRRRKSSVTFRPGGSRRGSSVACIQLYGTAGLAGCIANSARMFAALRMSCIEGNWFETILQALLAEQQPVACGRYQSLSGTSTLTCVVTASSNFAPYNLTSTLWCKCRKTGNTAVQLRQQYSWYCNMPAN